MLGWGKRRREDEPERLWGVLVGVTGAMVTAYFLLPLDAFGSDRPEVSWTVFVLTLVMIALLLLKQMRDVLLNRTGVHPGFVIPLLVFLTVLVFSAAYYTLAKEESQIEGLRTRLDALYFTVTTLATVSYGDIVPIGQTARVLAIVQIIYNLVFLTAAATTLSHRFRTHVGRRWTTPDDRPLPDTDDT